MIRLLLLLALAFAITPQQLRQACSAHPEDSLRICAVEITHASKSEFTYRRLRVREVGVAYINERFQVGLINYIGPNDYNTHMQPGDTIEKTGPAALKVGQRGVMIHCTACHFALVFKVEE